MSRASISSLGHSPSISSWWGSGKGSEQGDDKQRANSEIRTNVNAMFIRNSGNFAGAVGANGRDRTESGDAVISTMFTNQFYKHQKLVSELYMNVSVDFDDSALPGPVRLLNLAHDLTLTHLGIVSLCPTLAGREKEAWQQPGT